MAAACTPTSTTDAADKAKSSSSSKVEGSYTNPEGNALVEFMAAGKAYFSLHGVGGPCKFKQAGNKLTLTVEGEDTLFTVDDNQSLTGPTDSFMTRMKKKKE